MIAAAARGVAERARPRPAQLVAAGQRRGLDLGAAGVDVVNRGCKKLNFAKKRAQIRKEVEEVFFKLDSAKLNISASYSEVLSARESLRLAKLRYKSGIATQRELVNNKRDLTD